MRMSKEYDARVLGAFFDSIEEGLFHKLRRATVCPSPGNIPYFHVSIGDLKIYAIDSDMDVCDRTCFLRGIHYLRPFSFLGYLDGVSQNSIKVVRPDKKPTLESLDERVKKLEANK